MILPSPQPGLYSIPGSNCIRTKTCKREQFHWVCTAAAANLVCWKKIEVIWRVGNHISFAGCIWTCAVVAEPEQRIFFTFVNFLLRLLIFQAVCCLGFCKSKSYTLVWLKLSCGFYRVSTKTKTKYGFSFAFVGGSFPIIWTFTTKDPSSQFETIVHCANM